MRLRIETLAPSASPPRRHSILDGIGSLGGGGAGAASSAVGTEYELGGRRLRVLRQLGEGGYSFVYLVREVAGSSAALLAPPAEPQQYALKRVRRGAALTGPHVAGCAQPLPTSAQRCSLAWQPVLRMGCLSRPLFRPRRCCAAARSSCGRRSRRWRSCGACATPACCPCWTRRCSGSARPTARCGTWCSCSSQVRCDGWDACFLAGGKLQHCVPFRLVGGGLPARMGRHTTSPPLPLLNTRRSVRPGRPLWSRAAVAAARGGGGGRCCAAARRAAAAAAPAARNLPSGGCWPLV